MTEPRIDYIHSFVHPGDEDLIDENYDTKSFIPSQTQYPPDGNASGTISIRVVDEYQNPMPNQQVRFNISYIHPGGNWRTAEGLKKIYKARGGSEKTGNKAKNLVNQGVIRVLGTIVNEMENIRQLFTKFKTKLLKTTDNLPFNNKFRSWWDHCWSSCSRRTFII